MKNFGGAFGQREAQRLHYDGGLDRHRHILTARQLLAGYSRLHVLYRSRDQHQLERDYDLVTHRLNASSLDFNHRIGRSSLTADLRFCERPESCL